MAVVRVMVWPCPVTGWLARPNSGGLAGWRTRGVTLGAEWGLVSGAAALQDPEISTAVSSVNEWRTRAERVLC